MCPPREHLGSIELEVDDRPVEVGDVERDRRVVGDEQRAARVELLDVGALERNRLDLRRQVHALQHGLQVGVGHEREAPAALGASRREPSGPEEPVQSTW